MRGMMAALCAALLVGLAPPSVFACAWAVVAPVSSTDSAGEAHAQLPVAAQPAVAPVLARAAVLSLKLGTTLGAHPKAQRLIWRSPSGPMPSQAPPARV